METSDAEAAACSVHEGRHLHSFAPLLRTLYKTHGNNLNEHGFESGCFAEWPASRKL